MSLILLLIPTACYALEGFMAGYRGDYAGMITFSAYSLANVGLIWRFLYT